MGHNERKAIYREQSALNGSRTSSYPNDRTVCLRKSLMRSGCSTFSGVFLPTIIAVYGRIAQNTYCMHFNVSNVTQLGLGDAVALSTFYLHFSPLW